MPREKRLLVEHPISTEFANMAGWFRVINAAEINLNSNDIDEARQLALEKNEALHDTDLIRKITEASFVAAHLHLTQHKQFTLNINQLLVYILQAEILLEIACVHSNPRLSDIINFLTVPQNVKQIPPRFIQEVLNIMREKQQEIIRHAKISMYLMSFDQRQKYILNPLSEFLAEAEEVQQAVREARRAYFLANDDMGTLFETYSTTVRILDTAKNIQQYTVEVAILVDHRAAIVAFMMRRLEIKFKDYAFRFKTETDSSALNDAMKDGLDLFYFSVNHKFDRNEIIAVCSLLNRCFLFCLGALQPRLIPFRLNREKFDALAAPFLAALNSISQRLNAENAKPYTADTDQAKSFMINMFEFIELMIMHAYSRSQHAKYINQLALNIDNIIITYTEIKKSCKDKFTAKIEEDQFTKVLDIFLVAFICDLIRTNTFKGLDLVSINYLLNALNKLKTILSGDELKTFLKAFKILEQLRIDYLDLQSTPAGETSKLQLWFSSKFIEERKLLSAVKDKADDVNEHFVTGVEGPIATKYQKPVDIRVLEKYGRDVREHALVLQPRLGFGG